MSDMEDQPVDMFSYDAENYKPNWVFRPRTHPQPSTETGQGAEDQNTALVQWNETNDRKLSVEATEDRERLLLSRIEQLENQNLDMLLARLDDTDRTANNSPNPRMISDLKVLDAVADATRVLESKGAAIRHEVFHATDKLNRVHNDIDRAEDKLNRVLNDVDRAEEKLNRAEDKLNRAEDKLNRAEDKVNRVEDKVTRAKNELSLVEGKVSRVKEETSRVEHELKHKGEKISEMDKTLADMFEKLRIGSAQLTHDDGSQALMETHPVASAQPLPRYVLYSIPFRRSHG
jgi:chromosome segregation ATPase